MFQSDLPASALFRDFHGLAVESARTFYQEYLGEEIGVERLLPAEQVLERSGRENADRQAFSRVVGAALDLDRSLPLHDEGGRSVDATVLQQRLQTSREKLAEGVATFRREVEEWEQVFSQTVQTELATEALEAGLTIEAEDFGLEENNIVAAILCRGEMDARAEVLDPSLQAYEGLLVDRFDAALSVFDLEALRVENPDFVELGQERDELLPVALAMAGRRTELMTLRRTLSRFVFVATHLSEYPDELGDRMTALASELQSALAEWVGPFTVAYPFEGSADDPSLGAWIIARPLSVAEARSVLASDSDSLDHEELFALVNRSLKRSYEVYGRVLCRLASLAERGERALGFEPTTDLGDESL